MKFLFNALGVGASLLAGWLAFDDNTMAWVALAMMFILFAFANMDRLASFSAGPGGVEARLRDLVQKSEVKIEELERLAALVGRLSLSVVQRIGRLGGYDDDQKERWLQELRDILERFRVDRNEVEAEWHEIVAGDYVRYMVGDVVWYGGNARELATRLRESPKDASPDDLRRLFVEQQMNSTVTEGLVEDFEYYLTNRDHRRTDIWRDRERWHDQIVDSSPVQQSPI